MTILPSAKFGSHIVNYENIVIGHSINALLYAYANNYPLISNAYQQPSAFDYFDSSIDFSAIGLDPVTIDLNSADGVKTFGHSKLDVWQHLSFCLSLAGQLLISDKISSLRIEENILKVFAGKAKRILLSFNKLHVFDSKNIDGLEHIKPKQQIYRVHDWIDVRRAGKHEYDYLFSEDSFVKEVFFFPSDRIDGNHTDKKDIVAISYLTEQQLSDTIYSDTYARFFVKQKMQDLGIRGMKNGRNPNYPHSSPDPFKRLSIKLENRSRDMTETKVFVPETRENVAFVDKTVQDILSGINVSGTNYLLEISKKISMRDLLIK